MVRLRDNGSIINSLYTPKDLVIKGLKVEEKRVQI